MSLPDSRKYFRSLEKKASRRASIEVSRSLSQAGVEVSPATINYAYEQMIGGTGRLASKIVNAIKSIGEGEMPPAREIPFVSRFVRVVTPDELAARDRAESLNNAREERKRAQSLGAEEK